MPVANDFQDALVALLLAGKAWYLAASSTLNAVRKMLKAGSSLALAPLKLSAATGRQVVGPYLPDVSRALSLDAALSGPPARLPSPAAPLSINPNPFAEPPVHQPEDGHAQQLAALLEAAEGALHEDGASLANSPASPTAAPSRATAEAPAIAAPAGEGQHRRQLEEEKEPVGPVLEGAAGDEEDRIEAGYDRLGSVPSLSVAPSAEGVAAYTARQLSAAQHEAEQEPLLRAPTSTATDAADISAEEAASAAAAAFAREAAQASQPLRPPSVKKSEGADRLLAGDAGGSAASERDQAAGSVGEPEVREPMPAPILPSPKEELLLPASAGAEPSQPYSTRAEVPLVPAAAPAVSEATAAMPLPASPGELLRSQTGPVEEEEEEEAPPAAAHPSAVRLPAQQRPSSAEHSGFITEVTPSALDATKAVALANTAWPGWLPEGLAEPIESPAPNLLPLPLTGSGASGGVPHRAAPSLPSDPAATSPSAAGKPLGPGTPALAAPLAAGPVPDLGLEPSSPAAPLPPADRANTAFTAELSAAANDLISDG
ncbi:hypothetical protein ABPG77_001998 [Micractinium sp. CCAP 211/92]